MKKLITIILILALILPASALALDESGLIGCYARYELLTTGCPSMTMLYLGENHVSFFLIQSFREDEPGLGRAYVGTWEIMENGHVYVKTGNNTSMELIIAKNYSVAYDQELNEYYINISLYDLF